MNETVGKDELKKVQDSQNIQKKKIDEVNEDLLLLKNDLENMNKKIEKLTKAPT